MPTSLQIPIVKVDMVSRETADGHTSSFLVIDTEQRTASVVQQVFDLEAVYDDLEHRWVRMSVPRIDAELMALFPEHQAQELLIRICDGETAVDPVSPYEIRARPACALHCSFFGSIRPRPSHEANTG